MNKNRAKKTNTKKAFVNIEDQSDSSILQSQSQSSQVLKPECPPLSNDALTAMLTEYSELRQEIRNAQSKQTGMISLYVTILAAIFAAAAQIYTSVIGTVSAMSPQVIAAVFIGILPLATEFMGVIYLDQVYRQVKLGVYVHIIEQRVNKTFPNGKELTMNWESWAQDIEDEGFFSKTNNYNYYVSLSLFILVEPISILFGLIMLSPNFGTYVWIGIGAAFIGFISLLLFFKGYKRKFDELMILIPSFKMDKQKIEKIRNKKTKRLEKKEKRKIKKLQKVNRSSMRA